ncbi:MAG: Holliday junction branch migration DNA helicase RuvB [Christensenellales bacterium]
MNKQFKDSINKAYGDAINAMEEGKPVKLVRLSLLECAAILEAVAKIEFSERTKLNALGYKLLGVAKKLGTNEMDVESAYQFLTGSKLIVGKNKAGANKKEESIDIDAELDALAKMDINEKTTEKESNKESSYSQNSDKTVSDSKADTKTFDKSEEEIKKDFADEDKTDSDGFMPYVKTAGQKKGELRVSTLSEYVGQEKIKPLLKEAIAAAKSRNEPLEHVLMFGSAGLGKTTLAKIIANEMGGECIVMNGATIKDVDDFIDVIKTVKRGDVVFIDEIHRMSTAAAESIYKAMEDFELQFIQKSRGGVAKNVDMKLPPFTLIGATTHSGLLTKPMRDRFSIKFKLEPYTVDELAILATNSMRKLGYEFADGAAVEIAKRSRGIPRICNSFVKRIRDKAQLLGVQVISKELAEIYFKSAGIDENGLDEADVAYMTTLFNKFGGNPVGIDTLCAALGEGRNIVEEQIEPYLIYLGFINVSSSGRELTPTGENYIKSKSIKKSNENFYVEPEKVDEERDESGDEVEDEEALNRNDIEDEADEAVDEADEESGDEADEEEVEEESDEYYEAEDNLNLEDDSDDGKESDGESEE